ncbi:MAG: alpha/beta hydrolase [Firmicutes bacterium]|nr:alpha/beta hydrolase [Bacillota bacterium]
MNKAAQFEKIRFMSPAGHLLAGLLAETGRNTLIIICHGFTGGKEGGGRAVAMAEALAGMGYSTLLFDFTGSGESEGDFAGTSLTRHVADITAAVDFGLNRGFEQVVTVGRSFGGAAVVCHGALDRRVGGVCAWAAPARLEEVFSAFADRSRTVSGDLIPLSGERGTVYLHRDFFSDLARHDVPAAAAALSPRPLLVLHGSDDTVVPLENARLLYSAAGEPKAIHIVPGADHQFTGRHEEAWEALFNWLKKHFPL